MSISPRMLKKLLGKLGEIASRVRELEQTMQSVRQRQEAYDAKSDAVVVPPGSTLFQPGEVRLFEITGEVADAKVDATLLALDSEGDMEDDPGDDETYSLRVPREDMTLETGDMVAATFEGVDGGAGVYVIVGAAGGSQATVAKITGGTGPTYEASEVEWINGAWGFVDGGREWDDANVELREINGIEGIYAQSPQPLHVVVRQIDGRWFFVAPNVLPKPNAQYEVLQADANLFWHADWPRAHP